ncbi:MULTISPECIES: putative lipid II flippase FtsW [Marinobacter]|uniref:Probable peptidoglycan glycosyltransferase FtsW n=1 Tax=Marinobacter xestospongiae TaxID=994319 RepID=A0ABU3VTC7_9GAMM|nr:MULTISPECIES: putative lipid II flippase FtsW [Marinobacter]MCG8518942.1 putative lipid II flippase FtsW [Pseudomonadales bacterium]MDV2077512.1 putative lipid II flippase FtsW [Marinobacter xestospongiae]UDL04336.1 putative lipid II flippase FtsW [Marinobacter sp. CA1]
MTAIPTLAMPVAPAREWRPLPWLLLSAGALLVLGIIMISSASMDMAAETVGNGYHYVVRQLIFAGIGCVVALLAANVPLSWWERSGWLLLGVGLLVLVLVLTPLGRTVNGSTRWIPFGLFNVQVSEIAKVCLIAYLAGYMVRRRDELVNTWSGFIKPMGVLALASVLLVIEPDFGATVVLMSAALGMIFLSGVKLTRFLPLITGCVAIGVALVVTQPYRLKRVVSYLDPWKDQFDTGYQLTQSLIAFGRGDWAGVGLGNSVQKLFFLPEAHTDFIFAITAEEFGLIGSLLVLALMSVLVLSGFAIARRAETSDMPFAASFAYGITLLIGLQAVINMGVSTGLLPTKGLTLPLMSYGGSSLLVTCACIGILARVEMERNDRLEQAEKGAPSPGGASYD